MDTKFSDRTDDPYKTLDLPSGASRADIDRQYERLKRLYQPDRVEDAEDRAYAAAKLAEIEEAYTVLTQERQIGSTGEVLYCANHPTVETLLRCNRCGKPICMKCAVQTPVGYRCKDCVNQQQKVYFNAVGSDNIIAFVVGLVVAAIAAPILGLLIGGLGFWGFILAFVMGSGAGSLLAQIIRRAVGKRRGRRLPVFALIGIVLGVVLGNVVLAWVIGLSPLFFLFNLPMLLFTVLALGAAYPQLR